MTELIKEIQNSLIQESTQNNVSGWIFTNFEHRDSLTDNFLKLDSGKTATRRWVYLVPTDGSPKKIVHSIETDILDSLPGDVVCEYHSFEHFREALSAFAGKTFAVLADPENPMVSTVDGGFVNLLGQCGIRTVSAASLIQRCSSLLTESGIESQERSASVLYRAIEETWSYLCECFRADIPCTEKKLQDILMQCITDAGLITDSLPIVAFGKNTGNPHYEVPSSGGAVIQKGDVVQFDIWAKEKLARDDNGLLNPMTPVYADISWVGVFAEKPTEEQQKRFETIIKARDTVKEIIETAFVAGKNVTGLELDREVRKVLISAGYEDMIKHRTGHGIDTDCHGRGVNLDCIEFPDKRILLEGSCFSVEPGLYGKDFGMRTEIDIYIKNQKPVISGSLFKNCGLSVPQQELLLVK